MFELHSKMDTNSLSEIYARHGRLQITDFLSTATATALYQALQQSIAWRLTINRGEEILNLALADVAKWSDDTRSLFERAVILGARAGFQFRYEVIRLDSSVPCPALASLVEFLSSPPMIEMMQAITGDTDISFADAHASRFQPGHFLTAHDDRADNMGRRAAYVLNLTPKWRPDWGGMLQFYDVMGNVSRGFTPAFNVLTLFPVPQPHSVSWVTPLAPIPRLAVTGWLRSRSA